MDFETPANVQEAQSSVDVFCLWAFVFPSNRNLMILYNYDFNLTITWRLNKPQLCEGPVGNNQIKSVVQHKCADCCCFNRFDMFVLRF